MLARYFQLHYTNLPFLNLSLVFELILLSIVSFSEQRGAMHNPDQSSEPALLVMQVRPGKDGKLVESSRGVS